MFKDKNGKERDGEKVKKVRVEMKYGEKKLNGRKGCNTIRKGLKEKRRNGRRRREN